MRIVLDEGASSSSSISIASLLLPEKTEIDTLILAKADRNLTEPTREMNDEIFHYLQSFIDVQYMALNVRNKNDFELVRARQNSRKALTLFNKHFMASSPCTYIGT